MDDIIVHPHALKRGLTEEEIIFAWMSVIRCHQRQGCNSPIRYVTVSTLPNGNSVQLIAVRTDDDYTLIIHALSPATKKVLDELGISEEVKVKEYVSENGYPITNDFIRAIDEAYSTGNIPEDEITTAVYYSTPVFTTKYNAVLTAKTTQDMKDKVIERCEKCNISPSQYIRSLISADLMRSV